MNDKKLIRVLCLIFRDLEIYPRDLPKLRGFLADRYPEITELHNHLSQNSFDYRYPVIQYRIIDGCGALLAIKRGLSAIEEILFRTEDIRIGKDFYKVSDKEIIIKECEFGVSDSVLTYSFISPWMALNEKNYDKYHKLPPIRQQSFLRLLLRENLKTVSKGCGYTIPNIEEIEVEGYFKPIEVKFKNQLMLCFNGDFMVNFALPEYFALGKQVARGFGVVKKT